MCVRGKGNSTDRLRCSNVVIITEQSVGAHDCGSELTAFSWHG